MSQRCGKNIGERFNKNKKRSGLMNNATQHRSWIVETVTFGVLTLVVLSALLLIAARPAQAQTETVLYNFQGEPDGAGPPSGLTSDGAGNYYGMTNGGGAFGYGTVYELSPNGSGTWTETVLYNFTDSNGDGARPYGGLIFDTTGNLYGTTSGGGANGGGTVFELT